VLTGPNPFAGGPPLVWYAGGEWTLIVLDGYAEAAAASGCRVVTYLGYTIAAPIDGHGHLLAALRGLAAASGMGRIGVEERALPLFLRAALPEDASLVPIDGVLAPLRVVKTAEELAKLRANFALTDAGQAAARAAVRPGQTELDVWAALEAAILKAAGRRVPIGNDCTVGRRAHSGGWPLDVTIEPGDSFVVDLSTQLHGYWSDSCATFYAGEPNARQVALHRTVAEALELAISLARPGAVASDIDRQVRGFIAGAGYPDYFHHTGHGVGVTGHEEPRIVPYNNAQLEAGMVVMLEPGVYFPGETAVRLEDAVLVTESGAEVLTRHDKSLP
jgi:Xaa-Pro aminopeptidase